MPDSTKRLIANEDLFRLRWVDAPRLSPDGARLAYTVIRLDKARDVMMTEVCCDGWRAEGHSPAWSRDGRLLAFVGGDNQLWLRPAEAPGAMPLTRLPVTCGFPVWSPQADVIAFVAGRGLWLVDVSTGETRVLTAAHDALATPCWLPDGGAVVCSVPKRMGSETELLHVPLDGRSPPTVLWSNPGPIKALACSHSGAALAWIGHDCGLAQGVNFDVWRFEMATRVPRNLTGHLDRCAGLGTRADDARGMNPPELVWAGPQENERVYFFHAEGGASHIAWVDPLCHVQPVVTGQRSCLSFDVAANRLAFVVSTATEPGEVHCTDLDGGNERALTTENAAWLGEVSLAQNQPCGITASDGATVEGWLLTPPHAGPGVRHPLILQIHGGPHYALGHRFYFEFQRLAAQGYAVLFGNPRGSQGYGAAFATQIRGAWAGRDYLDLMELLEVALPRTDVDPDRLAVTGVSYGAYMTHWIIARTQRFAVAISENGISNLTSDYAGTTNKLFWQWQMHGTPDEQPERYRALSPIHDAGAIRTPLLLIHAEQDENCPIGQSEEMLAALRAAGGTAELMRVPAEGHLMNLVGRPGMRMRRAQAVDAWLAKHLHKTKEGVA